MAKTMSPAVARLHRLQGQLEGVEAMMHTQAPISKVLQQIEAVRGSLKALEKELIEDKARHIPDSELKRAIQYVLKIS
jgi:DNA-binding FrmR family transcriptional regulator